jgi:hypothetical protein
VSGIYVVERLDHGAAQLLRNPLALGQTTLDRFDSTVALARIVITSIDDHHAVRRIGEQTRWQARDILLRDGDDDEVHAADCIGDRGGGRAGFGCQI